MNLIFNRAQQHPCSLLSPRGIKLGCCCIHDFVHVPISLYVSTQVSEFNPENIAREKMSNIVLFTLKKLLHLLWQNIWFLFQSPSCFLKRTMVCPLFRKKGSLVDIVFFKMFHCMMHCSQFTFSFRSIESSGWSNAQKPFYRDFYAHTPERSTPVTTLIASHASTTGVTATVSRFPDPERTRSSPISYADVDVLRDSGQTVQRNK